MENLPLKGIRVIDMTVVWSGPYATQMLADWGTEADLKSVIQKLLSRGNVQVTFVDFPGH